MFKSLKSTMLWGFFFTAILGTLFHFLYEWTGKNALVGLFTPINESIWEHIKLLFFPMLLYMAIAIPRQKDNFPCIAYGLSAGLLLGSLLIPVLYYTYSGILGTHYAAADIAIYYLCVLIAFITAYRLAMTCRGQRLFPLLKSLIFLWAASFFLFTFFPPALPLFAVP